MSNTTERTPVAEQRGFKPNRSEMPERVGLFANPIIRIVVEALLVFGLALGIWYVYTNVIN